MGHVLMRLSRYEGNPILAPNPNCPWEDLAVFNPGAWYDRLGDGDGYSEQPKRAA